jgi:Ferric uptake regulator family
MRIRNSKRYATAPAGPIPNPRQTRVHARAPDVHLSTNYRNLEELERLGVIDSTRLGSGPATYHLASAAHGHLGPANYQHAGFPGPDDRAVARRGLPMGQRGPRAPPQA